MEAGKRSRDPVSAASVWLVLAVAIGVLAGPGPTDAHAKGARGRSVVKHYVTGDGGPWLSTAVCNPSWDTGVGAVCLGEVTGGRVTVKIEDRTGRRVGGWVVVTDGEGTRVVAERFCGRSGTVILQPGVLFVHLDGPKGFYGLGCPLRELSYATEGRVLANFSS